MRFHAALLLGCLLATAAVAAAEEAARPADYAAVAEKLAPALVRVEYTLRPDKGEEPQAHGYTRSTCPVRPYSAFDASEPVREERPLAIEGFLIEPALVVSPDPMIHPRFVEAVAVRFGDQRVPAKPVRFARAQNAVLLELEKPLDAARPLAFDAAKAGPYLTVTYGCGEGTWTVGVSGMSAAVAVTETGRRVIHVPLSCLIVAEDATAVGMSMTGTVSADDSWKGSPKDWPAVTAEDLKALQDRVSKVADQCVLRAQLGFRSPKKEEGRRTYVRDEEAGTEQNVSVLLIEPKRVLVLANLEPKVTARLERVQVYPPEGDPVTARFECTLQDYGGFVAALEKPLAGALGLAEGDVRRLDKLLLVGAEVRIQGENRVAYLGRRRIPTFELGWKENLYPVLPGRDEALFLFDDQAALVAFPIARRPKGGQAERFSRETPQMTAAVQVRPVLADLARHSDPHNVPLSEEEESRLAWLGVLLQPLNRELARANQVSHLTQDGQTGAIVSLVFPGSPADQAGVKVGWILLRLHVEGYPKPMDVRLEYDRYGEWQFPWDRLDEVDERYFDQIPTPWPPVENAFTRMLTDIGFGKKFQAELVTEGKVVTKDFEVAQSPPHYQGAPKFKAEPLGLTVRDMTYEVRRYFQKKEDEPGVVISKLEPGSRASVAGIKPYEVVTHVNDRPVLTVKDFEEAIKGQKELKLSVKRMMTGRVVRIKLEGPPEKPPEKPPEEPEPPEPPEP